MANKHQQRGGQHYPQDRNFSGARNQMGGVGQQGNRGQQSAYQGSNQGQFGGNYGQDTNYHTPQEYGDHGTQGDFQGYADNSNNRFGNDANSGANNETYGNYGLSRDAGYNPRETNANDHWEPENGRGPRGYGHSQSYGGALGYQEDAQRGSRNWQQHADRFQRSGGYNPSPNGGYDQGNFGGNFGGNGGQHHDPDYHQWRNEQIRALDNDYKAWRDERYTNFSTEFGEWRKGRKDAGTSNDSGTASATSQSGAGTTPKNK